MQMALSDAGVLILRQCARPALEFDRVLAVDAWMANEVRICDGVKVKAEIEGSYLSTPAVCVATSNGTQIRRISQRGAGDDSRSAGKFWNIRVAMLWVRVCPHAEEEQNGLLLYEHCHFACRVFVSFAFRQNQLGFLQCYKLCQTPWCRNSRNL